MKRFSFPGRRRVDGPVADRGGTADDTAGNTADTVGRRIRAMGAAGRPPGPPVLRPQCRW
ncbi:hypothetical protein GCM10010246_03120 [Streptomyces cuspidosporus]|uniref:Uncharacterized protein n=1 Tax=Streptomyces cuspidosporus TaxID=66882 RepID=A0ABN3FB90_9ACTN